MLTQEDFLRPSASMILNHPFLLSRINEDVTLVKPLIATVPRTSEQNYTPGNGSTSSCSEGSIPSLTPLQTVEKEPKNESIECPKRKPCNGDNSVKKIEGKIIAETRSDRNLQQKCVQSERSANRNLKNKNRCIVNSAPTRFGDRNRIKGTEEQQEKILQKQWKTRLMLLRAAEANVMEREKIAEEREREISRREKRIAAMEQEAKQHLVRAQIYLKQTKTHRDGIPTNNISTNKKILQVENADDSTTTVSADIGYDIQRTSAFLNTQPELNPFLKMRQNNHKNNGANDACISFFRRYHTLDNPNKNRKKKGNSFCFDVPTTSLLKQQKADDISRREPLKMTLGDNNVIKNTEERKKTVSKNKEKRKSLASPDSIEGKENQEQVAIKKQQDSCNPIKMKENFYKGNIHFHNDADRTFRIYKAL